MDIRARNRKRPGQVWSGFRGWTIALALSTSWMLLAFSGAQAQDFRLLRLDGVYVKWGAANFRTPARVSYAILNSDRTDPDAINCRHMTGVTELLRRAELTAATFEAELAAAFELWREAAGLEFVQTDDFVAADIVIGSQAYPRGIAYTNVAYSYVNYSEADASKIARLTKASVCLNPSVEWEAENDSDLETFNLRRVFAHEIGHTLGLNHPGRQGELMGFGYTSDASTLMEGDVLGIRSLYGLPTELVENDINTASSR